MAYIYRILNKITKKCYIGESKSKDVNWRWREHKRKIEINKGCPALRDAVKKYGIEIFEFSVIIICFDDERFKYEKEYIKKYNSVVPNGYNITGGGEGGGFQGKKHTEQVKADIRNQSKQKYIDNPELRKQISERNKIIMKNPEVREKIKNGLLNSEKWKKVIEEKRIGNYKQIKHGEEAKNKISESLKKHYANNHNNQETKNKISEGMKKYHANNPNTKIQNQETKNKISEGLKKYHASIDTTIEKDNKLGKKVEQYDMNNNFLYEYISVSDASRKTSVPKSTILTHLKDNTKIHGREFIWKYA
jgi:group I intron endonuclease